MRLPRMDALPYSVGTREDKKSRAWPVGAQAQARDSVNIASSGIACLIFSWISSLHSSIASLCDIALIGLPRGIRTHEDGMTTSGSGPADDGCEDMEVSGNGPVDDV